MIKIIRKGSVFDIPVIIIIVFSIVIGVFMSYIILDKIITNTDDSMIDQEVLQEAKQALSFYDKGIMIIVSGLFLFSIVLAYQIRSSPIFFFPALLFLSISIWLASEFSNIFWIFANIAPITSVANDFPAIVYFYQHQPLIIGIFGLVLLIVLYAKSQKRVEVSV